MVETLSPPALEPGDTIGIIAPSNRVDHEKIKAAATALANRGYSTLIAEQVWATHGQSAGTPQEKASGLHDMFRNPDVKAIIAARGGNRAGTMLGLLDYELIKNNPKILIGYSDVTSLLNAIYARTGLVTFHGPVLQDINNERLAGGDYIDQCFTLLSNTNVSEIAFPNATPLTEGRAKGRLVGGNLSLISSLIGTPYLPDMRDAILFLEDCGDELSRIDRMTTHLKNAGILKQISGLILGSFTNMTDTGSQPFDFTLEDILSQLTDNLEIPVVMNAPFGHGNAHYTFPIGTLATLNATQESVKLAFAASPVS